MDLDINVEILIKIDNIETDKKRKYICKDHIDNKYRCIGYANRKRVDGCMVAYIVIIFPSPVETELKGHCVK